MSELTRIDDGPVATVYAGHRAGVPVAVKVFPRRFDKRTMSAFTKEQTRLATVRRITSILMVDAVEELPSGESALRMELCTQSLAGLVERTGPLAALDVAVLGRAMAVALAAAHSVGVVHGGVSPSNVLFRDNAEPVVGDFGVTLRQAFTRDPLHAIEYLPPETLRTGALNELTDLYGLGAVLHFALTARSPHPGRLGEQPGERVLRILGEPVPAVNRADVPVGLSTLVARLLATAPEHRPPDASQVADLLTAMLPNPPAAKPTEDWDDFDASTQLAPPPRRREDPLDFDDFATSAEEPGTQRRPPPPHGAQPARSPAPRRPAYAPPVSPANRPMGASSALGPVPAVRPVARPVQLPAPRPAAPRTASPFVPPTWAPGPTPHPRPTPSPPPATHPAETRVPFPDRNRSNPPATRPPATRTDDPAQRPAEPPAELPASTEAPRSPTNAPSAPPASAPPAQAPTEQPPPPEQEQVPAVRQTTPLPATALDSGDTSGADALAEPPAPVTRGDEIDGNDAEGDDAAGGVAPGGRAGGDDAASGVGGGESAGGGVAGGGVAAGGEPAGGSAAGVVAGSRPDETDADEASILAVLSGAPASRLPLAPPPTPVKDGVLQGDAGAPAPVTVEFASPLAAGVVLGGGRRGMDLEDDFGGARQATVLAGPPEPAPRRLVRYDLLAGAALVLALLALVPLLLLRGDPDEMSTAPQVPAAGGNDPAGEVTVELATPTDLTDKVQLSWKATRDLDFAVVVAAEGVKTRVLLAERNHTMTVDVEPGLRYCFMIQASDGDQVYESEPQPLRGASCRK